MENRKKIEIEKSVVDLQTIYGCICKYWWIIAVTTILLFIVGNIIGNTDKMKQDGMEQDERYIASVMLYIDAKGEVSEASNAMVLIKSSLVLNAVDEELKKGQMPSLNEAKDVICVAPVENSDFITVTAEGADPEREAYIVNTIAEVFQKDAPEILELESCKQINDSEVTKIQVNINTNKHNSKWIMAAFGVLLGCAILVAIMIFNGRIWSCYDIKKCFANNYWGYFPKGDLDWLYLLEHLCEKNEFNNLYIRYSAKGSKGKRAFEQISKLKGSIHVFDFMKMDYGEIAENGKAYLIIERGIDTYKEINNLLIKLECMDIEIIGCICV